MGVFAKKNIPNNTVLGEYVGVVKKMEKNNRFYCAYPSIINNESLVIDSKD